MTAWSEVCANRHLKDLPYKVETNRFGKLLLSVRTLQDGRLKVLAGTQLDSLMPGGETLISCGVDTTDGTRVADVAWVSAERMAPYRESASLPIAPEICIEVLSHANTREEMLGKMPLYFSVGAREVWLCHEQGAMEFFLFDKPGPSTNSILCAAFSAQLQLD